MLDTRIKNKKLTSTECTCIQNSTEYKTSFSKQRNSVVQIFFFNKMQELSYYVKIFPMFRSATQTANPHLKKTTALVQSCKGSCLSLKPNGVPQHTDIKRKLNKHCTYIFTHFALKYRNRETQEQPNNLSPWKVTSYTHARI